MFHDMPASVAKRMEYLEQVDACDRADGTPRLQRLRQIPPCTGRFLALMAASAPAGTYVEIGTSAGYSALWIALACRALGRRLVTFEVMAEKASLARESFAVAGVEDVIDFIHGDARKLLYDLRDISFCFLDAEKEIYQECYEAVVPKMMRGGILVVDNVVSHEAVLRPVIDHVLADRRVDALIVPIGKGELVCRKA
jgi:caffeoyl-CoA O-methyltransferase